MTILNAQLLPATYLPNAVGLLIAAPALTTYRLGRTIFSNVSGGAVSFTIYLVPPGGSSSAANSIINPSASSIAAGATYVSQELAGLVLPPGATLQGYASAASSIVCVSSGLVIT